MSANNWAECPQCKINREKKTAAATQKVQAAYGKVPAEEYLKLLETANKRETIAETLREDWEVGVLPDGEFYVIYSCQCRDCTYRFAYKYEVQTELKK